MCGRMTLHDVEQMKRYLEMYFNIYDVEVSDLPRYNMAPKQKLWALIYDGKQFRLGQISWGIQLKSQHKTYFNINARIESVTKHSHYKKLLSQHRALILLDGYYEWKDQGDYKQPYYIHELNKSLLVIPALYQKDSTGFGVTLITKEAQHDINHIHERMPYLLMPLDGIEYLKNGTFPKQSHLNFTHYEVSHFVNSVSKNDPHLISRASTWIDG